MSKRFLYALAIAGSLTFLSIPSLLAGEGLDVRSKIPFTFRAGQDVLPPGTYEIREKADAPGTLVLSNADGKDEEFLITTELSNDGGRHKTELVFENHGKDRYLKQVWEEGLSVGREIPTEGTSTGMVRVKARHSRMMSRSSSTKKGK